jgi:hypothetical protein
MEQQREDSRNHCALTNLSILISQAFYAVLLGRFAVFYCSCMLRYVKVFCTM